MLVEHTLTAVSRCPVDDAVDVYEVIVRTGRLVKVEDILAAVKDCTGEPVFQEALTERLAAVLRCEVETRGWHKGVRTVVVCGSAT